MKPNGGIRRFQPAITSRTTLKYVTHRYYAPVRQNNEKRLAPHNRQLSAEGTAHVAGSRKPYATSHPVSLRVRHVIFTKPAPSHAVTTAQVIFAHFHGTMPHARSASRRLLPTSIPPQEEQDTNTAEQSRLRRCRNDRIEGKKYSAPRFQQRFRAAVQGRRGEKRPRRAISARAPDYFAA
jgi:hypothetical protein